jgi:hypothetical protein
MKIMIAIEGDATSQNFGQGTISQRQINGDEQTMNKMYFALKRYLSHRQVTAQNVIRRSPIKGNNMPKDLNDKLRKDKQQA